MTKTNEAKKRGRGRPPKPGGSMPQLTVRLPKSVLRELARQARKRGCSRNHLARQAIKRFLLANA
jgi:predicted HicB family RNase H-like nuclease